MHDTAYENCERFIDKYLSEETHLQVLDVGSYDVNGTLKPLFARPGWQYVGMDHAGCAEKNVDVILHDPFCFPQDDASIDVIVSSSALEHDPMFWVTFQEMTRVSRPRGLIYLNVPSQGPYHAYPQDCWRFLKDAHSALARWTGVDLLEHYIDEGDEWMDNVGIFRVPA